MKKFINKIIYLLFGIVAFIAVLCVHCFLDEIDCICLFIASVGLSVTFIVGYDRLTNLRIDELEKRISPSRCEDK